jgi:hypothetical protein
MAITDTDPAQRLPRRRALANMGVNLGAIVIGTSQAPVLPFDPTIRYPLETDFGDILVDRERERDSKVPIGSARFAYIQNYRPGEATAGAIELLAYMRLQEGLLRVISQQEYPGKPPEATRTLFAGTFQFNERAWHRSVPIINVEVGDHLLVAIGVTSINTDPSDPETLRGLSYYRLQRLPNQSPNLVTIGRGFHEGIISYHQSILDKAEERADFDLSGKRRN